jgi:hypothetical protein
MGGDEQMDRKALCSCATGAFELPTPRTLTYCLTPLRSGYADATSRQDPGLGGVPMARVYVGIAAMGQGQWLPEVDVAEKTWQAGDLM